jgi:hypothetical protein
VLATWALLLLRPRLNESTSIPDSVYFGREGRKQKHTARRIHQRLAQEYDFDLVSYSTVCDYVLARRPQIEAEILEGRGT